jgi:hypothetical protein
MPKRRRLKAYKKRWRLALGRSFLIFLQAAAAFGGVLTGLDAGRHLGWW